MADTATGGLAASPTPLSPLARPPHLHTCLQTGWGTFMNLVFDKPLTQNVLLHQLRTIVAVQLSD